MTLIFLLAWAVPVGLTLAVLTYRFQAARAFNRGQLAQYWLGLAWAHRCARWLPPVCWALFAAGPLGACYNLATGSREIGFLVSLLALPVALLAYGLAASTHRDRNVAWQVLMRHLDKKLGEES
jgi:hypothetical protein